MRISDWSSDVCSSDLHALDRLARREQRQFLAQGGNTRQQRMRALADLAPLRLRKVLRQMLQPVGQPLLGRGTIGQRSEEHTSELQSLMRISYAVFCLQKKKTHENPYNNSCNSMKTTHKYNNNIYHY